LAALKFTFIKIKKARVFERIVNGNSSNIH
jgi:hypothetical protein